MSEYLHIEKPFLDQLAALGWKVTDRGHGIVPSDPAKSLRTSFRDWFLPVVCRDAVRSIHLTRDDRSWLEANDATRGQVERKEVTDEAAA